jgi:hypothetical protein
MHFFILGIAATEPKSPKLGDVYLAHGHQQSPMFSSYHRKLPKQIEVKVTELQQPQDYPLL